MFYHLCDIVAGIIGKHKRQQR